MAKKIILTILAIVGGLMTVANFYCPPSGFGVRGNYGASWATLKAATTGIGGQFIISKDGSTYYLYRQFMPFDTRSIPVGSIINSWKLKYYREDSYGSYFAQNVNNYLMVCPSTQSDPTAIADADFDNISFTNLAWMFVSAMSTNHAYYTFSPADNSRIVPEGYTKLAVIHGFDNTNTTPTGLDRVMSSNPGDANPPYLEIDYTPPPEIGSPILFRPGFSIG